jgi:hypothetical protein
MYSTLINGKKKVVCPALMGSKSSVIILEKSAPFNKAVFFGTLLFDVIL